MSAILLDELSFNTYSVRDLIVLLLSSVCEFFGFRQFVTLANFSGLWAWLVGKPLRGKPLRGKPTVPRWKLPAFKPDPDTRNAQAP